MGWIVKFHKNAKKFLKEIEERERKRILNKLNELKDNLDRGVISWKRLHIRKLKGEWEGYFRMRVGKMRVIFEIDIKSI